MRVCHSAVFLPADSWSPHSHLQYHHFRLRGWLELSCAPGTSSASHACRHLELLSFSTIAITTASVLPTHHYTPPACTADHLQWSYSRLRFTPEWHSIGAHAISTTTLLPLRRIKNWLPGCMAVLHTCFSALGIVPAVGCNARPASLFLQSYTNCQVIVETAQCCRSSRLLSRLAVPAVRFHGML